MVRQEVISPWELARLFGNLVGKVHRLLVDDQFFECERHDLFTVPWISGNIQTNRNDNGQKVERRKWTTGEAHSFTTLVLVVVVVFLLYSLLSTSLLL